MLNFPVKVCHNIWIVNNKILPLNKEYRGKSVSKREFFYGIKVQVIATIETPYNMPLYQVAERGHSDTFPSYTVA